MKQFLFQLMQNQLKAGDLQKFISGFQILNPDVIL